MTAEEIRKEEIRIASLPGMQAFFSEKMGELAEGDKVALKFDRNDFNIGFVTQTKTMERDVISADLVYVRWHSDKPWRDQSCDKRDWAEEHFIRLPLPIDPVNPERGLWGMCDGVVTIGKQLFIKDSYFVSVRLTDEAGNYKKFVSFKGSTPTLALLHAIAAQIGQEV